MARAATVRLTRYCKAAGCAAKLPAGDLERLLEDLSPAARDGFDSGMSRRDDAGWIEFGAGLLLQSVDFFTPIVDDPRRFGRIAAANALSDIYAMGGEPLSALNLAGFPEELELGILREILDGGGEKIAEAGAALCGGHTVRDSEPKYGVAVTGFVDRERLVRNRGAGPGDALVLTKPLGTGILSTALKREEVDAGRAAPALDAMERLNDAARDAMLAAGASAATDVTGYGLLGHLNEMLGPDGLGADLVRSSVPVFDHVAELAADGCYPGGLERNRAHLAAVVSHGGLEDAELLPLFDPQTSGGLLIAVDGGRRDVLLAALEEAGELAAVVGRVSAEPGLRIRV